MEDLKSKDDNLKFILEERDRLEREGLLIHFRTLSSPQDAWIVVDRKKVLNLCSNNYLGMANHPALKGAAQKAIDTYGVGPAAVRTIAGTMSLHTELEEKLARFKRVEAVVSFQSGFNANLAAIPSLAGRGDVIFSDELNHASIIDGCRLSGATVIRYAHGSAESLEARLSDCDRSGSSGRRLVVTDGVFSMDGDIAPLPALVGIAEKYRAVIMVDDAHGEGVLGTGGRGVVDHFQLHNRVHVEVGTLSKAFGVVGGFVAGKKILVDHLRQKGRPFLFSSASTPADVAACIAAVGILEDSGDRVETLWRNTRRFRKEMQSAGFDTGTSETPIIPVLLGEATTAQEFSRRLFERGVFAMAIGFPTVPLGKARIRAMISAAHSDGDLDYGIEQFVQTGKEMHIIS